MREREKERGKERERESEKAREREIERERESRAAFDVGGFKEKISARKGSTWKLLRAAANRNTEAGKGSQAQ